MIKALVAQSEARRQGGAQLSLWRQDAASAFYCYHTRCDTQLMFFQTLCTMGVAPKIQILGEYLAHPFPWSSILMAILGDVSCWTSE